MINPYQTIRDFEKAMAEFVNSPYAVAVDSCTNALFLSCYYCKIKEVTIPCHTYVSVPCSIIHAGGRVIFNDYEWTGQYKLEPYPIYDSACQLKRNMYIPGTFQCISFSANKPINIGKGGMIFTDNKESVEWLKKARYEGRSEIDAMLDNFDMLGWNMYMTPEQAARGLVLLSHVKSDIVYKMTYPDLSRFDVYKNCFLK